MGCIMASFRSRIVLALFFVLIAAATNGCAAGCGGSPWLLRVATDSIQHDPTQANVVHADAQVCVAQSGSD
jgi:hypothetical protein